MVFYTPTNTDTYKWHLLHDVNNMRGKHHHIVGPLMMPYLEFTLQVEDYETSSLHLVAKFTLHITLKIFTLQN